MFNLKNSLVRIGLSNGLLKQQKKLFSAATDRKITIKLVLDILTNLA